METLMCNGFHTKNNNGSHFHVNRHGIATAVLTIAGLLRSFNLNTTVIIMLLYVLLLSPEPRCSSHPIVTIITIVLMWVLILLSLPLLIVIIIITLLYSLSPAALQCSSHLH